MKTIVRLSYCLVAILFLSVFGCSSTGKAGGGNQNPNEITPTQANVDLATYLRRIPGVQIIGSGENVVVHIRGGSQTITGRHGALFVVDNMIAGNSYATVVGMVDVNDIERVKVLKGVDASAAYGFRGSNGVIEISTKKSNN
jgi:TonB-dependent SusC/RagA subfamily outer membrane receptor